MLIIFLLISVISMILFVYKLMGNGLLKYIISPVVGLFFGYLIYIFGMALNIYILFGILFLPVIGMIYLLSKKDHV